VKNFVFVSDAFVEQYVGGAELTTEAILRGGPTDKRVAKVNCQILTLDILKAHKDDHYVICNFANLDDKIKLHMCKNITYTIIEYDYKFCKYRSMRKHFAATGSECDCVEQIAGKINSAFYSYAKKVWFMSEGQRDIFLDKIPTLKKENTEVLSSVFSPGDLRFMKSIKDNEKDDKYLILGSGSWIKGTEQCIKYAKDNDLSYEVVKGLPYHELLIKMSTSAGLIFLPLGYDTCPRFVIEARLLGCDLILNDYVQHKDEDWFQSQEACDKYMRQRATAFWSYYE
tara:strand:+ start:1574 stop:2425 length:852 start_codon:yes stop_codon:yes gene_type:complete